MIYDGDACYVPGCRCSPERHTLATQLALPQVSPSNRLDPVRVLPVEQKRSLAGRMLMTPAIAALVLFAWGLGFMMGTDARHDLSEPGVQVVCRDQEGGIKDCDPVTQFHSQVGPTVSMDNNSQRLAGMVEYKCSADPAVKCWTIDEKEKGQ